jgi:hypothetical protein
LENLSGNYLHQVFFLFYNIYLKKQQHLVGQVVTKKNVEQATQFWNEYFGNNSFDKDISQYLIEIYDEHLSIHLKVVPERRIILIGNVFMIIENMD